VFSSADAYDRFMGRYSRQLSPPLADLAGVVEGTRVLDVGCGSGVLTAELLRRRARVTAIDPSPVFVEAVRTRHPGVDARVSGAEKLPFENSAFDAAIAQLVVHFMADPRAGLQEMARVVRPGGVVAACVWDHETGRSPVSEFTRLAESFDHALGGREPRAGSRPGELVRLFREAGLEDVEETTLPSRIEHATFDEWWEPFTLGVGPLGARVAGLAPERQAALREHCRRELGPGPIVVDARAWTACGRRAT